MPAKTRGLQVQITAWHPELDVETCTGNTKALIETALAYCSQEGVFAKFQAWALEIARSAKDPQEAAAAEDWWRDLTPGAMSYVTQAVLDG